ncbi:MAG: DUF721 domain-containing protein [Rhizobiales bacterium]|nr:DUF721 domain-containing protein [Hyphomicrobiales bacterium]
MTQHRRKSTPSETRRAPDEEAEGFGAAAGKRRAFAPAQPTAVGAFVPAVARKAFEKYGFHAASLITDWPEIAGDELSAFTNPERLTWPRMAEAALAEPTLESDRAAGQRGATLVLRVDGARALEIQHRKPQILERINTHFGYRAVTDLKILQAPVVARFMPKPHSGGPRQVLTAPAPSSRAPRFDTSRLPSEPPSHRLGFVRQTPQAGAGTAPSEAGDARLESALGRLAAGVARRLS